MSKNLVEVFILCTGCDCFFLSLSQYKVMKQFDKYGIGIALTSITIQHYRILPYASVL